MKIAVATERKSKVDAIKEVFENLSYLKDESLEFFTQWTDPEVGHMPLSLEETLLGASNRIKNLKKIVEADFYVAIEGGAMRIESKAYLLGVAVIENSL